MLVSLKSEETEKLKQFIVDNPKLPLVIFANEDANTGEYVYELAIVNSYNLDSFAILNNQYIREDDYEENLTEYLSNNDQYSSLSNTEFDLLIKKKMAETKFEKCIAIYVG